MSADENNNGCREISAEMVEKIRQEMSDGMSENMGISALLDDEISSAEFTILSAQFSANPTLVTTLKTQCYVLDALAGFSSPDYCYTERIMAYIQRSVSVK